MRIAIDTNVLAYGEGVQGGERAAETVALLRGIPQSSLAIPVQVLGELFRVLVRKAGRPRTEALATVTGWTNSVEMLPTTPAVFSAATGLAVEHGLDIWDAIIVAAAAEGACDMLLSEDMHDGFAWRGVTVVNPYASPVHPLLAAARAEAP